MGASAANDGASGRDSMHAAMDGNRPKIRLPGDDWLLSDTAATLGQQLRDKLLFVRNGELVTLDASELRIVTSQMFRTLVERHVVGYRKRKSKNGTFAVDVTMTDGEARGILASSQFLEKLRTVVRLNLCRLPILRGSREIELLPDGYDLASQTLTISSVSYPEDLPIVDAIEVINDLFSEFIFADKQRSKAVAVAALVGMYCPELLPEGALRPCVIITKNAEGAGATTLVRCAVVPVVGALPTGVKSADEDETRKALTAIVREGRSVVLLDNQKSRLSSAALESFLSTPTWTDRLLGVSQMFTGRNLATLFVTSNGCRVSPDMRRRSLFIELHLEAERAEDRIFRRPSTWRRCSGCVLRFSPLAGHWCGIGSRRGNRGRAERTQHFPSGPRSSGGSSRPPDMAVR